ncbi:CHAT domain-containing protein [Pedobacter aquatilis]|uniref:CHAT domain-containing protein n=1 Tax=Pedobacter aquatilis TaxID=351343 RepID=UPI0025B3D46C|nr:CHAT domain-containing protein [Pedobacter aquatilis]MDN3586253.1 CHAT domain-containing protein [Pedobacter aquatilis]
MVKKLSIIFILLIHSLIGRAQDAIAYKKHFDLAEHYANALKPSEVTDALALKHYLDVIHTLSSGNQDNKFLLRAYITTGAFMQVLDRQQEAISLFRKSFDLKKNVAGLSDSVLFAPYVYCGNSYFRQDKPDSANIFYLKAKEIADRFPDVDQQERLFNTLGVMAYSTGNYNKSIPYYEKAISVLRKKGNPDKSLHLTYQNNLASAFRKLKRYQESLDIYRSLLSYKLETENINHNIGSVYLAMGKADSAILYFNRVNFKSTKLLNDLAKAYLRKKDADKALFYLNPARALSKKANANSIYGNALKLTGDAWVLKRQYKKGASYYQYAISSFSPDFDPNLLNQNPVKFTQVFNTIDLLEALIAKANAQKLLCHQNNQIRYLEGCLNTFRSFYKLADHISRFYDNDEARLLIGELKYTVHNDVIDVCLQLFKLTKESRYMQDAFYLDEENKASNLSISRDELTLRIKSVAPKQLLSQEKQLKNSITRISLMASAEVDHQKLKGYKQLLNDDIIKLGNVLQKIKEADEKGLNYSDSKKINLSDFQRQIPAAAAVLSYHVGTDKILCFVITRSGFDFFTSPIDQGFNTKLIKLDKLIRLKDGNNNKAVDNLSGQIYNHLLSPAMSFISGKKQLYIIPDDKLSTVPFEVLGDRVDGVIINRFAVTYNYSCKILQNTKSEVSTSHLKTLGFAPFTTPNSTKWAVLSASAKEFDHAGGARLLDEKAKKDQFLKLSDKYSLLHLATHAFADNENPAKSFIAFYPQAADSGLKTRLYLPEIYNLNLQTAKLVILSACESGNGTLINGEGLMSLARAFSYAGCNNIITSMWNADDASTAAILDLFHQNINQGISFTNALNKAKQDYLQESQISPAKKRAAYWAHIRFIGGFEQEPKARAIWIYAIMIPICVILALISRKIFSKFRKK